MDYLIGDLQGCCDPLEHLLAKIDFSPSRDRLHLLGDLVNRGPQSLPVLRRLAAQACGWLLVHAGVIPQWDAQQTLALAGEIEALLRSPDIATFLPTMYGNQPRRWDPSLEGPDRWRFIVNTLTRMRLCSADGELELKKDGPGEAPPGMLPWFGHANRLTRDTPIAFGHWSQLGLVDTPLLLSTDTGCVWGGALTAVRVDDGRREVIQVPCPQALKPG